MKTKSSKIPKVKIQTLFQYLGRPAGPKLGREVEEIARLNHQVVYKRHVKNVNYNGLVNAYNSKFLEGYFKNVEEVNNLKEGKEEEANFEVRSLFEYLNKPSGSALGKEIHYLAKSLGEEIFYKDVNTVKYQGKISCYGLGFLNYIFTLPRVYNLL
jgi:hypothetical protein